MGGHASKGKEDNAPKICTNLALFFVTLTLQLFSLHLTLCKLGACGPQTGEGCKRHGFYPSVASQEILLTHPGENNVQQSRSNASVNSIKRPSSTQWWYRRFLELAVSVVGFFIIHEKVVIYLSSKINEFSWQCQDVMRGFLKNSRFLLWNSSFFLLSWYLATHQEIS